MFHEVLTLIHLFPMHPFSGAEKGRILNKWANHLRFGGKSIRVLGLHIWNQLPETLKAKYLKVSENRKLNCKS